VPRPKQGQRPTIWRQGAANRAGVLLAVQEFGVPGRQKFPKADPHELTVSGSYRQILLKNSVIWVQNFPDEDQTTWNFIY
jgi:hypothetical protein